jgi:sulfite exporter TauE/SafE
MCGGLVTYSTNSKADIWKYQFGRLLAYLLLGLIAGLFGTLIHLEKNNPKIALIPGLILGMLFLYWGFETLKGKRAEIPMPKLFTKIYSKVFGKLITHNNSQYKSQYKSLITGLLSIFLPCGILYSVVLTVASFETKWWALFSMFFFWLGTLPAMVLAPNVIKNLLNPMRSKVPKIYATVLIVIGISTIGYRVTRFQQLNDPKYINRPNDQLNCH